MPKRVQLLLELIPGAAKIALLQNREGAGTRSKETSRPRHMHSGDRFDEDACGFDGWYSDRADAMAQAEDWVRRFPHWIVGLVRSDLVWFGNGDFSKVTSPLTYREAMFLKNQWASLHAGAQHHQEPSPTSTGERGP
jgi:hypothetical protein